MRHVLLQCQRWAEHRKILKKIAGYRWGDVSYMLGGWGTKKHWKTGELLDGPMDKWKPDLDVVAATVQFLKKTGRLDTAQAGTGGGGE